MFKGFTKRQMETFNRTPKTGPLVGKIFKRTNESTGEVYYSKLTPDRGHYSHLDTYKAKYVYERDTYDFNTKRWSHCGWVSHKIIIDEFEEITSEDPYYNELYLRSIS
jgi:hypothetical protein